MNNNATWTKKITPYLGSHLEPFSFIKEGFSFSNIDEIDVKCNDANDVNKYVQTILTNNNSNINTVNNSLMDLSQNIFNYNVQRQSMLNPNPNTNKYYDYIGSPPPTLQDGVINDNYDLAIKENTLHIVGSITLASLLIAAIILAKD
jgi:hypothetical protein